MRIRIEALGPRPIERVEIVAGGDVIHRVLAPDTDGRWIAEFDHVFSHDGWVAARAFEPAGRTIRFAHTSPVYIDVGMPQSAAEDAGFFLAWIAREMAFFSPTRVSASRGIRRTCWRSLQKPAMSTRRW